MRDRLLVTGARGQLGTDLVAEFRRRADVVGCDLDDFDITDPAAVRQHVAAVRPTVVIHAAAFTELVQQDRIYQRL
ncbi:MAG TPA: sugar nucleotide-binding protein, partial [candidate division Zixibacteria bacterium]|nr:sugar nucleotide-binding protein [candidate division Zixibacteria bacterium]